MTHDHAVADGAQISETPDAALDAVDKRILSMIQSGFPIVSRPYQDIGAHAGVSETEALERVRSLRKRGLIRRMGANFQSGKIGYTSTLCAAKVPAESLETFIATVNGESGVTHNYLREHAYNVWFTVIAPSTDSIAETLAGITARTGVPVLNLPAQRLYKIKVDFKLDA